jgi:hypothetical protein
VTVTSAAGLAIKSDVIKAAQLSGSQAAHMHHP